MATSRSKYLSNQNSFKNFDRTKSPDLSPEVVRILTKIGFRALERNLIADAETIFIALQDARPHADFPIIGLALVEMTRGSTHNAVSLLEHATKNKINTNEIAAFLGLAYFMSGRHSDCIAQIESVMDGLSSDCDAALSRLLAEILNELSLRVSPFDPLWKATQGTDILRRNV